MPGISEKPVLSNQDRLRALIEAAGLTQKRVAEIVEARTFRPCSLRTVQSWLAAPGLPSARNCPDWVFGVLDGHKE